MLEQKDIDIIRSIMKEEIAESENRMESVMNKRIAESEERMESVIHKRITESENLVLKELDRVQIGFENKISAVQKNLDELSQYYRITKLENDNTALLLKMIDELSKRVEELERKTA